MLLPLLCSRFINTGSDCRWSHPLASRLCSLLPHPFYHVLLALQGTTQSPSASSPCPCPHFLHKPDSGGLHCLQALPAFVTNLTPHFLHFRHVFVSAPVSGPLHQQFWLECSFSPLSTSFFYIGFLQISSKTPRTQLLSLFCLAFIINILPGLLFVLFVCLSCFVRLHVS